MTFGSLLKEFLDSSPISRDEYQDKFGMTYYTMHKYFTNKSLPGYRFIYKLKKAGMDISKIFNRDVHLETIEEWERENGKSKDSKVLTNKEEF